MIWFQYQDIRHDIYNKRFDDDFPEVVAFDWRIVLSFSLLSKQHQFRYNTAIDYIIENICDIILKLLNIYLQNINFTKYKYLQLPITKHYVNCLAVNLSNKSFLQLIQFLGIFIWHKYTYQTEDYLPYCMLNYIHV